MTSLPQTHPRIFQAEDGRYRAPPAVLGVPQQSAGRVREVPPPIDPAVAFGCVDWFLYPDQTLSPPPPEH